MENQTAIYLDNANLSKAAYANLKAETCQQDRIDNINALKGEGFSQVQAEQFLVRYQILNVLDDPVSGAYAVLIRDSGTGKSTLAIRGTNDTRDITADQEIGVLGFGLTSNDQYTAIKTFYDNAVADGIISAGEKIDVTGHSLGGFLGTCFTLMNSTVVDHAYTFNSPGLFGAVFQTLTGLGLLPANLPFDKITNVCSIDKPTRIAGWGILVGDIVKLPGRLHFIQSMIDELSKPGAYYCADNKLHWGIFDFISGIMQGFQQATSAAPPRRVDPLIIDLDGDGIETVASTNGAYFDHDGNGFAERTGWVSGDDGLLVRDINSDGIINNGGELFGDQTLLQNGQLATGSFQALADLDSNADGKSDTNDTDGLLKNAHMLRCASFLGVATYAKSTSHFSGFARLASEHF